MYTIRFAADVVRDLRNLSASRRNIVLAAIETQLSREPTAPTNNRKLLVTLIPPWDAVPPMWERRVGESRVVYDVSAEEKAVYVRAVRRTPPGRRTEEIL